MSPVTTAAASAASAASSSGCVRAGQQLHTHPSPPHKHRVRAHATTRLPRVCNCYEQPRCSPAPSRAAHVAGPLRTSATQPEKTLSLLLLLPHVCCCCRVQCNARVPTPAVAQPQHARRASTAQHAGGVLRHRFRPVPARVAPPARVCASRNYIPGVCCGWAAGRWRGITRVRAHLHTCAPPPSSPLLLPQRRAKVPTVVPRRW